MASKKEIKSLVEESLKEQEKHLLVYMTSHTQIITDKLDDINLKIEEMNKRINGIESRINTIEESTKESIKDIECIKTSIQFTETELKEKILQIKENNNKTKLQIEEKLRTLEDRERRNNLRIGGLKESENESWLDTEQKVRSLLKTKLNIDEQHVAIERAHRNHQHGSGRKPRTITMRLLNYKDKEVILKNCWKLKGTDIFISEDYSKATVEIRKKLLQEVKERKENGERVAVRYDKIIKLRNLRPQAANGRVG